MSPDIGAAAGRPAPRSAGGGGGSAAEDEAVAWLVAHKPAGDNSSMEFLRAHAKEAIVSREAFPWAASVPLEMFQDWVLPYTHFDERPENWRSTFTDQLSPLLKKDMSLQQAATAVQQGIWKAFGEPAIVFKSNQTPQVLSPSDVFAKRHGSCTGLSIFLVDGLRSCGIPARVVGTAEWNRPEKGNHNWVEVWFDGRWNFIDAAPGPATWNEAWFVDVAHQAIEHGLNGIYTPIKWQPKQADALYPVTWRTPTLQLPAIELTAAYQASHRSEPPASQQRMLFGFGTSQVLFFALAVLALAFLCSPQLHASLCGNPSSGPPVSASC